MVDEREQENTPEQSNEVHGEAIHLPGPSYWPLMLSVCLIVALGGLMVHPVITAVAALAALGAVVAWGLEDANK